MGLTGMQRYKLVLMVIHPPNATKSGLLRLSLRISVIWPDGFPVMQPVKNHRNISDQYIWYDVGI